MCAWLNVLMMCGEIRRWSDIFQEWVDLWCDSILNTNLRIYEWCYSATCLSVATEQTFLQVSSRNIITFVDNSIWSSSTLQGGMSVKQIK